MHTRIHVYTPPIAKWIYAHTHPPPYTHTHELVPYTRAHTPWQAGLHSVMTTHSGITNSVILKVLLGEKSGEGVEGGRTRQPLSSSGGEWPHGNAGPRLPGLLNF